LKLFNCIGIPTICNVIDQLCIKRLTSPLKNILFSIQIVPTILISCIQIDELMWTQAKFIFLDHGVMGHIFFTVCCDKITCLEFYLFIFFPQFCQKRVLTSLVPMIYYLYYIYTRYINAFIKVWSKDLMEAHHDLNH
jgi:hypothetical protein